MNSKRDTAITRYRAIALAFAVTFAAVGLVFLLAPGAVLNVLDRVAALTGRPGMPAADADAGLFRALAVAYMYFVTLLAWMMFRRPAEPVWPALLAHAKLASAIVSLFFYVGRAPYLVFAANGIVDGAIGLIALLLWRRAIRVRRAAAGEADHERPALSS